MIKSLLLTIFSAVLLSCSKNMFQQKEHSIKFKNTGRHISINLKVNQYDEGNFYFDTGSPWFLIDSTFYENQKMSFTHFAESENAGVGNNPVKTIRILDTIEFSIVDNTFFSKHNMIYNLKNFRQEYRWNCGLFKF